MTLTLLCALAQGAWADDVNYIYYTVNADGKTITKHTDGSQADPTVLTSTLLEKSNEDNLNTGWYVLNSTFSYGYYFNESILSGIDQLIQIDVSFYLHRTMNLWHMCQFFSAKIIINTESAKILD